MTSPTGLPSKKKITLLLLMLPLMLWALPLKAQEATSPTDKPKCQQDDVTKCRLPLRVGQKAPFEGVLLSTPFAAEFAARMQECLATVDAEKTRADKLLAVERAACAEKIAIVEKASEAKQAAIKQTLKDTQDRELACNQALADEQSKSILWIATGAATGLVVGALIGVGGTMYFVLASH